MSKITYVDEVEIVNKKILLRVDFNVSLSEDKTTIFDDTRIKESLPTINLLLKNNNRLFIISHFGRPKTRDSQFSLKIIGERLQQYLFNYKIILIDDFLHSSFVPPQAGLRQDNKKEIFLLENIRFYPQEKTNDENFTNQLAAFGEIYINDAFGVCHRNTVSVVGLAKKLPAYGGLLLKKEINAITPVFTNPQKPLVTIVGGAKISTKINLLKKLGEISDQLLVGGAIANTFAAANCQDVGSSLYEPDQLENARQLIAEINATGKKLILPEDFVIKNGKFLDIGPQSQKRFQEIISQAKTIVWNGPVGYFEDPKFMTGSQVVLDAIISNSQAYSVVGGGDTLAFINGKPNLDKISHISTGGGAMLEFIEKGTLPGIEALKK